MYKIKYLESIVTNKKGNKSEEKFMTVSYGENDMTQAAQHWRAMGFVEIREIECYPGAKLSPAEIIKMFYDFDLDEEDKKIRDSLLQKYSSGKKVKEEPIQQIPNSIKEISPEEEKEKRKKLFSALKEKGIKIAFNTKTEDLEAKAKEKGIEI